MKTAPYALVLCLALTTSLIAAEPAVPATKATVAAIDPAAVPLSDAGRAKIAAMSSIFDGKTLDGWIEVPRGFGGGDVIDVPALAKRLAANADPLAAQIAGQLDADGKKALAAFVSGENSAPKPMAGILAKALSAVMAGPVIYDATRFASVKLRPQTESLLRQAPTGLKAMRLNRMLLEDALPQELRPSPLENWVVKDGALASVGAGRGELCTVKDYARYRIVFLVRHVSGKPDHQPGVLVFCQRPVAGKVPLDALGGVQFQVPNGGHWDYRTGHNNGGTSFNNPVKTKYDNHEWRQVELLVNADTGIARMAVAPAAGMRGVENLDFSEKEAGRAGPFALQMHNAGLFDEYKDIRIELDPKEDRLITVE
jgi:hypothetical protein